MILLVLLVSFLFPFNVLGDVPAGQHSVPAQQHRIGDVVGQVLHTDIVAYINDRPILSFNIEGRTAVVVEDLHYYWFGVNWVPHEYSWNGREWIESGPVRELRLWHQGGGWYNIPENPYEPTPMNPARIGTHAYNVLYTDIKTIGSTYDEDVVFDSFNVGGRTLIFLDDLAEFYGSDYFWCSESRELRLYLFELWSMFVRFPFVQNDLEVPMFIAEIDSELNVTDLLLRGRHIWDVWMYSRGFMFSINSIEADFHLRMPAPPLKVYLNGEAVTGELERIRNFDFGVQYQFVFDEPICKRHFNSLRIEFGSDEVLQGREIYDIVGIVSITDIGAYINDLPIRSRNHRGQTVVFADDLTYFGFDVRWEGATRSIILSYPVAVSANRPTFEPFYGSSVFYSDVAVILNGRRIDCINIDDHMAVSLYVLADALGGTVVWDEAERSVRLRI
jgi:hypothetical protein